MDANHLLNRQLGRKSDDKMAERYAKMLAEDEWLWTYSVKTALPSWQRRSVIVFLWDTAFICVSPGSPLLSRTYFIFHTEMPWINWRLRSCCQSHPSEPGGKTSVHVHHGKLFPRSSWICIIILFPYEPNSEIDKGLVVLDKNWEMLVDFKVSHTIAGLPFEY